MYLEIIFRRGADQIWKIFGRAGLMEYHDLGASGGLLVNHNVYDDEAMSD